jgi:hypothetical protein
MNIAWIALGYHTSCSPPEIITLLLELSQVTIVSSGHVCSSCIRTEKFPEEHICPLSNPRHSNQKPEHKFQLEVTRDYKGHINATINQSPRTQITDGITRGTNPLAISLTPTRAQPMNSKTTRYWVIVTPRMVSLVEQILINLRKNRRSKSYRSN